MRERTSPGFPEGVREDHAAPPRGLSRYASPLSLALLAALMALALSGMLGGAPNPTRSVATAAARLEVNTPRVIRNGEFFETRITVTPRRPIADLVLGVTPALWRDITVNTMIPAAAEEEYAGGAYRFSYGATDAGETLRIKIDSQINPSLFRGAAGHVIVYDGETPVAELTVRMRVLP